MPKHKHYDVIVAAAEGKEIQFRNSHGLWKDISRPFEFLGWYDSEEYRVKPIDRFTSSELCTFWDKDISRWPTVLVNIEKAIVDKFIAAHKGDIL